ncbi:hypothetical protein KP509_01G094400 [Ceratopteris richardii]|uniref:Biopterin transport-related protein BT1 n=3 Tax=Ceratopteris richardii TaxID=49495 RepID=A0A8T2VFB4_CERRI|nr:hypothetical protein KP509_01G094400 [Ceratopteris richardii]
MASIAYLVSFSALAQCPYHFRFRYPHVSSRDHYHSIEKHPFGLFSSTHRFRRRNYDTTSNGNVVSPSEFSGYRFKAQYISDRNRQPSSSELSQGQEMKCADEHTDDMDLGGFPETDSEAESEKGLVVSQGIKFFGVDLSADIIAITIVYFVQGVLGLSSLAVSFFLKDDLHLDPAESAVISGVSAFPWLIKPLYGFISDGLPFFGYRRRSYLVACGLIGAASWALMAMVVDDKYGAAIAIILSSLSVAFSDVVVDSMAVERARGESQYTSGSIQSLCWGSSAAGSIVSAYFSGSLIETYGVRFIFSVTAVLPLLTSAVAVFVNEQPFTQMRSGRSVKDQEELTVFSAALEHAKDQTKYLWKTIKEPTILLPTLFIFFWQATPTSDTAMFFFSTNKLGFQPEFLGRVRLITSFASLAGVGLYNSFLKSVPLRTMFLWTTILGCLLSLTQLLLVTGANNQLGISNEWFAMGDSLILTVLGQVSFMPVLVLAARICPPGVEATLFATLMSISNGGGVCGGLLGAWLTQLLGVTSQNFDNLAFLLIVCNATSLIPLPLLRSIPTEVDIEFNILKSDAPFEDLDHNKRT